MHFVLTTAVITLTLCAHAASYRNYYLDRYGSLINYDVDEDHYGIYHEEEEYVGYADEPLEAQKNPVYIGCQVDGITKEMVCNANNVAMHFLDDITLPKEMFGSAIKELIITDCAFLESFEDGAFDLLANLEYLKIQHTLLNHFPDISNTSIKKLNLAGNAIQMDTNTYRGWSLPNTITHMNLAENEIYWLPDGFLNGPDLLMVSLSYNALPSIHPGIFGDLPKLKFLGLDGNQLTTISSLSLAPLDHYEFKHLNLSHNRLNEIHPGSFSSMPNLIVLELHGNALSRIHQGVFHDLPTVRHIDLHANKIERLTSESFKNLLNLQELRLHSQYPPMTVVEFDAWVNIGQNLKDIFVSSNALTTFPHPVFEGGYYPSLQRIHADHNQITNMTIYSPNDFPPESMSVYHDRVLTVVPFSAYPNINKIKLNSNLLTHLERTDVCASSSLLHLDLQDNYIYNVNMDDDALHCLEHLQIIEIPDNRLQYVPRCFITTQGFRKLQILRLWDNYITFIPEGAFANLPALTDLSLQYNLIVTIENGAFPEQLRALDLGFNDFRFHHDRVFHNLRNLWFLGIHGNEIDYLPLNAFYNCCIHIDYLYLYSNRIPELRVQHFEWIESMWRFHAYQNSIGWIEEGIFAKIHNADEINFHVNKITRLPMSFANKYISSHMEFRSNLITVIPSYAFQNMHATEFYISENPIIAIEPYAFDGVSSVDVSWPLHKLRYVYPHTFHGMSVETFELTGARLGHLEEKTVSSFQATTALLLSNLDINTMDPEAFYDVTVHDLDLQYNGLTDITGPMFGGVSQVTGTLYLSNNSIEQISHDAFANVPIWGLNLNNNSLPDIPRAIHHRPFVQIEINNNLGITNLPRGSFTGLSQLEVLSLRGNRLPSIAIGVFDDLPSLVELDISWNLLEYLELGVFDNIPNLKVLRLGFNRLTHLHALKSTSLQILEAQYNLIATIDIDTFFNKTLLQIVYLDGNPLECDCEMIKTLDNVNYATITGTCAENPEAAGVVISGNRNQTTYLQVHPSAFMCSASDVTGQAISTSEIFVEWYYPNVTYFDVYRRSPSLSGSVLYTVTCSNQHLPTLNATVSSNYSSSDQLNTTITGAEPSTIYQCSVQVEYLGANKSARSMPAIVKTHEPAYNTSPGDTYLNVTFHDFSAEHKDFDDLEFILYTNVSYIASPYGSWLAVSDTPLLDTFSSWFRHDPAVNFAFQDTIPLRNLSPTKQRCFMNNFYPVDGKGFGSERQKDCDSDYHNFGFTTVLRSGLAFRGSEVITVAGGEGLWLFINKIKLLEYTSSGAATISCFVIDLAPAANQGGVIFLQTGTLVGEECTSLTLSSTGIPLELQIGKLYHFDLFHAETRTCKSEFLLQLENVSYQPDPAVQSQLDDILFVDEDFEVGSLVTVLPMGDVFSGDNFTITLFRGNEERRFSVSQTATNFTRSNHSQNLTEMTDLHGDTIAFLECEENVTSSAPLPYNTSSETFSTGAGPVYLIVANPLDYELVKEYNLSFTVYDDTLGLTGYIYLQIIVNDVNDNCPIITSVERFIPQPVLREGPLLTLNSTDADSGRNADIRYVVSSVHEDPARDYDINLDIWQDVYVGYTIFSTTIIAVDNGTIPRGSYIHFNITVSTSCLIDVTFGNISTVFSVDNNDLMLRIPGYYLYEYNCDELAGMSNGFVPNSWITASSTYDPVFTSPNLARLNVLGSSIDVSGAWVAAVLDTNQYLQVDMDNVFRFNEVHIQGRADADEWVTSFRIWFDVGNGTFDLYRHSDGREVFTGNIDRSTVVVHILDPFIISQIIRLNPQTWNTHISMRTEFKGCLRDKKLYFDTHCMRCETSYYCLGDGQRHMCGRCENNNATCHRDPTEHSFGVAAQCSPCPSGWICKDGKASPCAPHHYAYCTNTSCPDNCTHCEPGYACCGGKRTQCEPGTYSDGNMAMCAMCTPGSYQDQYAMSTCKPCAAGFYSEYGRTTCAVCVQAYYSTGKQCVGCNDVSMCPCLGNHTCFTTSLCYNTGSGGHDCLPCPDGYHGDGKTCTDINECYDHDPCFESRCINTSPGYQCLECPDGYTGTYEDAYNWTIYRRVFKYGNLELANMTYQTCDDINECDINKGGCQDHETCVNTIGSYYCRPPLYCQIGDVIEDKSDCDYCVLGLHNCSPDADCTHLGPTRFECTCKMGYAGNGFLCGTDIDLDGFPDIILRCDEWTCSQDNCPTIPNSMQENDDDDGLGNSCDFDDDNDWIPDEQDNCVIVPNFDQLDTDGDGTGDACDTCSYNYHWPDGDQADTDGDGVGDYCDLDDDNDACFKLPCTGINPEIKERSGEITALFPFKRKRNATANSKKCLNDVDDNCDLDVNPGQEDRDGDGVGDACDNCLNEPNSDQLDNDWNWLGNVCDDIWNYEKDDDGDTAVDVYDNCPTIANGDQSDIDADGAGDSCDNDIDNDGIKNELDNCPYLSNSDQADVNADTVGDACETDADGDGIDDTADDCPNNPAISSLDFSRNVHVDIEWRLSGEPVTTYVVNGTEVKQTLVITRPHMLIAKPKYSDIEYEGTWYVSNTSSIDYIGLVVGYRNIREFYTVLWKRESGNFRGHFGQWDPAIKGLQIKMMDAWHAPYVDMARSLWDSTNLWWYNWPLWHDLDMIPWEPETAYRWHLTFRPSIGLLRLKVYKGTGLLVDSGPVYDMFLTGGRVGVIQYGEFPMVWSNLKVRCLEETNKALYLDGIDDYVALDDIFTLQMEKSFTMDIYVMLDATFTHGPYPIFCSVDRDICLWIANGYIYGSYSTHTITTSLQLTGGTWYNIIYRYDTNDETLSLFIDGVREAHGYAWYVHWETIHSNMTMQIGKSGTDYFRGTIDEFRLYCAAVGDADIENYIELITTKHQVYMHHNTLYFRMEDSDSSSPSLANTGWMTSTTALRTGGTFVKSQHHSHRHAMKYFLQYYNNHN